MLLLFRTECSAQPVCPNLSHPQPKCDQWDHSSCPSSVEYGRRIVGVEGNIGFCGVWIERRKNTGSYNWIYKPCMSFHVPVRCQCSSPFNLSSLAPWEVLKKKGTEDLSKLLLHEVLQSYLLADENRIPAIRNSQESLFFTTLKWVRVHVLRSVNTLVVRLR